jgi:hypothetical protein
MYSISNLGMYQVDHFAAIINPPHVLPPLQEHGILICVPHFHFCHLIVFIDKFNEINAALFIFLIRSRSFEPLDTYMQKPYIL